VTGSSSPESRALLPGALPERDLAEGQIDRDEMFWFDAGHINAMIAVVEAEAVTAPPDLRDWLISLADFARRAADRHVGVVFVLS